MLVNLQRDVRKLENKKKAKILAGFFKTGEGEYGFGDVFLGISVPQSRKIAIKYKDLGFDGILKLLRSEIHEERLIALLILVHQFQHEEMLERRIYEFYLKNTKFINNWDLVDLSSPNIVGDFLINKDKRILYRLAVSENLWEKRISILACFAFIRNNKFKDALNISEILLNDKHDLIHKAVGWMLREIGKRNLGVEEHFLQKHYKKMPRTMLRYAIEKFDEEKRKEFLRRYF